jgi:serine/threonine protein kinase
MRMFGKIFGIGKAGAGKPAAVSQPKVRRTNLEKRFAIVAESGQGSMSKVYRAVDNQTGRTVCLKVQDLGKTEAAAARSGGAGRLTEGEIALRINHPNVVKTFEWGVSTKGTYFIVMEFIDGVSFNFVRESKSPKLADKLEYLAQAAEGLAAVHAAGYIHRDFGPKNLLVNRDDQVKLIDFGLAVPNTEAFHRPGNRTGTLTYMAPELLRREPTDERIDIFSFGATAFEFLTGKLPYDINAQDQMGAMRVRINSTPKRLEEVAPKLPAELCALVNKTLEKRPADRWAKAATLGEALRGMA